MRRALLNLESLTTTPNVRYILEKKKQIVALTWRIVDQIYAFRDDVNDGTYEGEKFVHSQRGI